GPARPRIRIGHGRRGQSPRGPGRRVIGGEDPRTPADPPAPPPPPPPAAPPPLRPSPTPPPRPTPPSCRHPRTPPPPPPPRPRRARVGGRARRRAAGGPSEGRRAAGLRQRAGRAGSLSVGPHDPRRRRPRVRRGDAGTGARARRPGDRLDDGRLDGRGGRDQ